MWYVVQVRTGTEESIRIQCEKQMTGEVLERCFIPYYEESKRIRGRWITLEKVLFPGYVFMISEKMESLYDQLHGVIGLTKMIGTGREIVPLGEEEISFLQGIGGEKQIVEMSEGVIEQSCVRITSGPLVGMEGLIRKIDRHKRKAWLEVPMFGRVQRVQVGVEIVTKV
ncbi:antiterminator LoaP [Lachnospiraceae bacterium 48-21]